MVHRVSYGNEVSPNWKIHLAQSDCQATCMPLGLIVMVLISCQPSQQGPLKMAFAIKEAVVPAEESRCCQQGVSPGKVMGWVREG